MTVKPLAPIAITANQRKWLEDEKKKTGNTFAVLVRNLIQDKISKEESLCVQKEVLS